MKILFLAFFSIVFAGCMFTTESAGDLQNGTYVSHLDSTELSQRVKYEWEIRIIFQHYYLTEIESRFDVFPEGEEKIWMRMIRREKGKYALDSGRIIYREVKFGFKNLLAKWDGEKSVLSLKPSDVKIDSPYDFKTSDSIVVGQGGIWKSQVQQFNTRNKLFRFEKSAE